MKKGERFVKSPCSSCFFKLLIFTVFVFILHAVFVFTPILNSTIRFHNILGNLFIVILSSLASIAAFRIYRFLPSNFPRERMGNLFLFFSLILMLLGDFLWLIGEVFFGNLVPIGGYPDLSWTLAYLFLIVSLIYFISISFRSSNRLLYLILAIGFIIGGVILYQDVNEDLMEGSFTFAHAIQDGFILFDVIVLLLICYLVWPMFSVGIRFSIPWLVIGFGVLSRLIYDRIFADMSDKGTYYTGHPVDLLYVLFYVSVVVAFYFKSKKLGDIK